MKIHYPTFLVSLRYLCQSERTAAWRKGKHDLAVTGPASACFGTLRGKSRVVVVNRRKCSESWREASIALVCQERVLRYNA
ncbi:unnamed protein product [Danaus chrysippus]|uniref:(African queen) hypothetical protein n=1 Tax=Danaus chrysippus TaxID=151541 RepID=A0A8J2RAJ1_9NEOP|nr:unnamed protein product [Danaus chrysippus]